jgi:hypothetical protein
MRHVEEPNWKGILILAAPVVMVLFFSFFPISPQWGMAVRVRAGHK